MLDFWSNFVVVLGSNLMLVIDDLGLNLTDFELSSIELKLVPFEFESGCLYSYLKFLKVLLEFNLRPTFFSTEPVSK